MEKDGFFAAGTQFWSDSDERSAAPLVDDRYITDAPAVVSGIDKSRSSSRPRLGGVRGPYTLTKDINGADLAVKTIADPEKDLLRASVHGRLRILLPLVSTLSELQQARQCIREAAASLDAEGLAYAPEIDLWVMIEVPSAVITADLLAAEADFFFFFFRAKNAGRCKR